MHDCARRPRAAAALATPVMIGVLLGASASLAQAQAWDYPSFQQSHVVNREFGFAVADGGVDGTSFVFQWREQIQPAIQQFSLDAGLAIPKGGGNTLAFLGGTYANQFIAQTDRQQIELLGTGGLNVAFGNNATVIRLPVGVSIGHRFPLQNGLAITPYAHPRVALEFCNDCGTNGRGRSDVGLGFGLGVNFEVTPQIALRLDTSFGFSSIAARDAAVGFGLAWSPLGLRRR